MDETVDPVIITKFLNRVIEIEENYAFVKKGQDSLRKEEIAKILDEIAK